MGEVFFISDTHFGHKAIVRYEPIFRPFQTVEEHDEELVKRWNSVVHPKDKVFHLGDAVFGKRNIPILGRLNGFIHLIMGNHDVYGIDEYMQYVDKISGMVEYHNGLILTHAPLHSNQVGDGKHYWANVHGHLHSKNYTDSRYVNVSCEQVNLTPVPLDEVWNRASAWGKGADETYG